MADVEHELRDVDGGPVVWLAGRVPQEVVGESHYQDALERLTGGKTRDGHELDVVAHLVPEPDNPHSKTGKAVRVDVRGEKVGYLPRGSDVVWQPRVLEFMARYGRPVACGAVIKGGWKRPRRGKRDDEGHFGVTLLVPMPPTLSFAAASSPQVVATALATASSVPVAPAAKPNDTPARTIAIIIGAMLFWGTCASAVCSSKPSPSINGAAAKAAGSTPPPAKTAPKPPARK